MSVSDSPRATRSSRTSTIVLAVVALLATFAAGVLAGAFGHRMLMRGPFSEHSAQFLMKRLDRRLDLNPQQEQQVVQIIERAHARMRAISANVAPQIHHEIDQANAEIDKILTPEQRTKFAEVKMRMQPRRTGHGMRIRHD